ncbi:MAG TPA: cytochrome P450 [Allosphingosinicella sp.]|nr:cytochrome P450 [Allosphingosinicella sp.]
MTDTAIPDHVPPELVRDWTLEEAGRARDPGAAMDALREGPAITFAPRGRRGGPSWMVNNYEMIVEVLQNPELFSSDRYSGFSRLLGEDWPMIPLEVDPPIHRPFRTLMNKVFAPRVMNALEEGIAETVAEIVSEVRPKGRCEFQSTMGRPLPTNVFLRLLGLPLEDADMLLGWERGLMHGETMQIRIDAARNIKNYLLAAIADREAAPRDDIVSYVAAAEVEGRPVTGTEKLGICFVLYGAGLDTVAATLGLMFKYLAEHPERQEELRADPSLRTKAVEEIIRAHSSVTTGRILARDADFHGVAMKKGDFISLPLLWADRDPAAFADADTIDFKRIDVMRHIAFGSGPHACMGSHLARRELRIVLDQWLDTMPPFRIAAGDTPATYGGSVFGVDHLPLQW